MKDSNWLCESRPRKVEYGLLTKPVDDLKVKLYEKFSFRQP